MSARVEARGVTVRDRLDSVSVSVAAGEIHALVGPNGSGKSTLLAVLAGDLAPDAGEVLLDGQPWSRLGAREAARRRALLAQETPLAFPFTAREVVGRTLKIFERSGWVKLSRGGAEITDPKALRALCDAERD